MRDFRKHTSWYLTGYPVGARSAGSSRTCRPWRSSKTSSPASIRPPRSSTVASASAAVTPTARSGSPCPTATSIDLDDLTVPDDGDVMALSGG